MRRASTLASFVAMLFVAADARAHLIPAMQGTLNVVGDGVFAVVSVPISSLADADDDHDGVVDVVELERHEASLRAEIDRRLSIFDGGLAATTVRVDLMLSPQHDAAGDRADQIVALKHARFPAPPRELRVRCDLFGPRPFEQELKLTATRHPASGTETEITVLVPREPGHAFFFQLPVEKVAARAGASSAPLSQGAFAWVTALIAGAAALASTRLGERKQGIRV